MIGFNEVEAAAKRLRGQAHVTPIRTSAHIDALTGARVFFKCENLQRVGAFKFRGATNAILSLSDAEAEHGVATQSSGNHGQAVALAAKLRGVSAYVVMPDNVAAIKRAAVEGYGAKVIDCKPTAAERDRTLERVAAETGAHVVHPYNDWRVMAGQGTAALELCEAVPDLDMVMTPVSGGGLLSGTAISVKHLVPTARVIGAEPTGADDAWQSFRAGRRITDITPDTIADGLRAIIGEKPFSVIRERVDDIVRVDDAATIRAMRLVWERMKLVIEPSAAVPVAALLERAVDTEGLRIGVILSGGNVDLDRLPWQS
ncbi:MAG TPA: pyridoxal-phosphate dependent enzyme [Gammaproteobacteria bacterium]|nr:pyridoxal-phosphate dependent enzyme [Gammaproteobacteria bacterium]